MEEDQNARRLYRLPASCYVEYSGRGELPPSLEAYVKSHQGEFPPYFFNDTATTEIYTGGLRNVRWNGKGPIPEEVVNYVSENGTLPPLTRDARYGMESCA
jgi:hypothetical protein